MMTGRSVAYEAAPHHVASAIAETVLIAHKTGRE
jgi:hypothetical protein